MIINPKVVKKGISEEQFEQWAAVNTALEKAVGNYSSENLQYFTFNNNVVTGWTGPSSITKIDIPATYSLDDDGNPIPGDTYTITEIGDNAFANNAHILFITLPDTIRTIGDSAFLGLNLLTSITIPENVMSINNNAFYWCYALAEVYNYSSHITISNVNPGSNVNGYLGGYAKIVYNASDLTGDKPTSRIQIFNGIQYYVYNNDFIALAPTIVKNSVTSVELDSRTTELYPQAFASCTHLKSIDLPNNVTTLGEDCLNNTSLTHLIIPSSVTIIDTFAIDIPTLLTLEILSTNITTGSNIDYLMPNAYRLVQLRNLSNLTEAQIATYMRGAKNQTRVDSHDDKLYFDYKTDMTPFESTIVNEDGLYTLSVNNEKYLLYVDTDNSTLDVNILTGITAIYTNALRQNQTVTFVNLGPTVKIVGENAFSDSRVQTVIISETIEELQNYAFAQTSTSAGINIDLSALTFMHTTSDTITLESELFYSKNAYELTVNYYGNTTIANYDYADDNATVTLNLLTEEV